MRLAWFWLAAATGSLTAAGCFSPTFPAGQPCAQVDSAEQCPGDLICVEGLCCPTADSCAGASGDGNGDDAPPDGRSPAFSNFGPYDCPEPNTEMLVHFDTQVGNQFVDACMRNSTTSVVTAEDVETEMGLGIDLNRGSGTSQYLSATTDGMTAGMTAYSVDALIENVSYPAAGELAVVASAATFNNLGAIANGAFILSINADHKLRLDLFTGGMCTSPVAPLISRAEIPFQASTHVRAVVELNRAELYIDGFLEAESDAVGTPCTDINNSRMPFVEVRLSGVRVQPAANETAVYKRLSGAVDEFRISNIARRD